MRDNILLYTNFLNSKGEKVNVSEAVIVDAHLLEEDENKNIRDCSVIFDKRSNIIVVSFENCKPGDCSMDDRIKHMLDIFYITPSADSKEDVLEFADKLEFLAKSIREVCNK